MIDFKTIKWTPTERRLLAILSDGEPHSREELQTCIGDELSGKSVLQFHIHNLRTKLRQAGYDLSMTCRQKQTRYTAMRRIANGDLS